MPAQSSDMTAILSSQPRAASSQEEAQPSNPMTSSQSQHSPQQQHQHHQQQQQHKFARRDEATNNNIKASSSTPASAKPAHHQSHLSAPSVAAVSNAPTSPSNTGTPIKRTPSRPNASTTTSSNGHSRLSTLSHRTLSTRPTSTIFPLFPSSLSYALVRDFAYPAFHPLHYGPQPATPYSHRNSTASSPYYDPHSDRRLSDPESVGGWDRDSKGIWSPGPWGGDGHGGAVYASPSAEEKGDRLPSTSFGFGYDSGEEGGDGQVGRMSKNHRKSKSLAVGEDHGAAGTSRRRRSDRGGGASKGEKKDLGHLGTGLDSQGFFAAPVDMGDEDDEAVSEASELEGSGRHDDQHHQHQHHARASGGDESDFAGPSLALYTFHPENANELALREGQVIEVGYRHGQGWLVAMDLETGEQGLVPEEYVRLLRDIEGWGEEDFLGEGEGEGEGEDETGISGKYDESGDGKVRVNEVDESLSARSKSTDETRA